MRTILGIALLGLLASATRADEKPPFRFNRMVAHWIDYGHPDYLPFIEEARPELVQVGFHGAHFYSLAHTPHGKGYPGHFPVQGLKEFSDWQKNLNAELHKRGVKVVGHFNVEFLVGDPDGPKGPTGFFKFYRDLWDENALGKKPIADPIQLLERNADGMPLTNNTYSIGGMKEYWACLNNPHWRAVLKAWVKAAVERGVDGLVANYFYRHNCLCEHCQKAFRAHLRERCKPDELKAMGIDDVDKHAFKEIVSWHDPKESTKLRREMLRFSQIATKQAFDEVFVKTGRALKPGFLVGQWNHLGNFGQIAGDERCLLPASLWSKDEDYLWYSTGGAAHFTDLKEGFLGEGTLQARYIRGMSGGKPYTLGKYEHTRIRVSIAELAANGGAPMGFYTNFRDPEARKEIVRYYNFMRTHEHLFKGSRPHDEAILLYPRTRVFENDLDAVEAFRTLGKKLLDEHVLFGVDGDDAFAEGLRKARPDQAVIRSDGKGPALDRAKLSRFTAPATVRVSMSRPAVGNELTLHLVNYDRTEPPGKRNAGRGVIDEKPTAVEKVEADLVLPAGARVGEITFLTPEGPASVLKGEVKDGRLRLVVPKFLVYGVVRIRFVS